jgi:Zn-dependent protease
MFKLKEVIFILLASAVLGYVIAFPPSYNTWLQFSGIALLILSLNILSKKLVAYKFGCELEVLPWTIERYGLDRAQYFRWPLPAWLIWPIVVVWLSLGRIWWLVVSTFEVYATRRRVGRKFAEVTEWDIGLIAAAGIAANLLAVVIASALGYQQFAFISLWFVFFNMLPFPAYDGGKIFFSVSSGRIFWVFMFSLTLAILILLHVAINTLTTVITALLVAVIAAVLVYSLRERHL